jgi:hypothetical protein
MQLCLRVGLPIRIPKLRNNPQTRPNGILSVELPQLSRRRSRAIEVARFVPALAMECFLRGQGYRPALPK